MLPSRRSGVRRLSHLMGCNFNYSIEYTAKYPPPYVLKVVCQLCCLSFRGFDDFGGR